MNFFWVNLGTSHKEVFKNKFLWAPQFTFNKNGSKIVNQGWSSVSKVKKGDIIFGHLDSKIVCIAKATKDVHPSPRPEGKTFDQWNENGWKVDIEITKIPEPVRDSEFCDFFIEKYNSECSPKVFTVKGICSVFYMSSLPKGAGALILSHIQDTNYIADDFDPKPRPEPKIGSKIDTVREAIIKARIGQGPYRKKLIELWNGKCSVTELAFEELLVASHIVPWSLCESFERIDPYNGLLLSPNLDKLFDKGLISFTDEGKLLLGTSITDEVLNKLGISKHSQISALKPENLPYLSRHRELFEFKY